jgi:ferric-dicitrate binding protein FerR (iron transport regulator)
MTSKEIDREIILAWLQGNYSIAQLRTLQEYLKDPAYRESLDKFLLEEWATLPTLPPLPQLPDPEQQYDKFRLQLPVTPVRSLPVKRWIRPAAAAAVLCFLIVGIWLLRRSTHTGSKNQAPSWIVLQNAPGEKRLIHLPDSSLVYLGAASTLKYTPDYNSHNRAVLLEGEAYFVVKHGGKYPFTVMTGDLATVDIGTEFNIRHYTGQETVEVAVAKGRVEVHKTETMVAAIAQGQVLVYDPAKTNPFALTLSDATLVGAWRKGLLVFRKRPLKEITDELERYYGVGVRYENPAHKEIVLTTLLDNRSLDAALDIVTVTAGVHYVRDGNTVVLK